MVEISSNSRGRLHSVPAVLTAQGKPALEELAVTVLLPKNKDLREFAEREFQILLQETVLGKVKKIHVFHFRGEDIPFLTERYSKKGHPVLGITGEDLLKEHRLKKTDSQLQIFKKIPWDNENYLFRKPTLCLLGPKDKQLTDFKDEIRITLNRKYLEASLEYLKKLEVAGFKFKHTYLSGETERTVEHGLADLCIEIVCTGKNAEECGLRVYEKIFQSNVVVIGRGDLFSNDFSSGFK